MASLVQANTLTASSSSSPDPELFTPPPSHTTLQQVPDVFVIPPEEEHGENPPFCYFDAAMESRKSLSILPDIDALDVALGMCQQRDNRSPVFHRAGNESQDTIVMPKRSGDSDRQLKRSMIEADRDVVEVVKVRRNEKLSNTPGDEKSSTSMKKSKTFRARASQALRSIKNVGKTTRKTGIPQEWAAASGSENDLHGVTEEGIIPRPSTPSIAGRKSTQISQIFASVRSKSSIPDVPNSPTSPTSPASPSSTTSSSDWEAMSRPSISTEECMNSPFPLTVHPADERPSISNKRSFVRRISARDIQRIFTLSNPAKPPPPETLGRHSMAPSPSRSSSKRESVMTSRTTVSSGLWGSTENVAGASRSGPATPRPHSFHGGASELPYSLSIPETLESVRSSPSADEDANERTDEGEGDVSFELRLDSLHFDSLQFDPDEFQ